MKVNLRLLMVIAVAVGCLISKLTNGQTTPNADAGPVPQNLPATLAPAPSSPESADLGAVLTTSLLGQNWVAVADQGDAAPDFRGSPILRAITAHACLALNRNNEALVLFLSLSDADARAAWAVWTAGWLRSHPDSAVAHYLRADAAARQADWDTAVRHYINTTARSSANPDKLSDLARAAHGVVLALSGRQDEAQAILTQVCATTSLAEPHASLGNLCLLNQAAKGAAAAYAKALELSPEYALALNGLGCARYGLADGPGACAAFADAARILPLPLFVANYQAVYAALEQHRLPGPTPAFQLTLNAGKVDPIDRLGPIKMVDAHTYKQNMSSADIQAGQDRMDHIYRPIFDAFEATGIPPLKYLGKEGNRHLDTATRINNEIQTRRDPGFQKPAGVLADLSDATYLGAEWPVTNWFGTLPALATTP